MGGELWWRKNASLMGPGPTSQLLPLNPFPGQGHGLCAEAGPGAAPGHAKAAASVFGGPAEGTGCRALLGPEGPAASGP